MGTVVTVFKHLDILSLKKIAISQ